MNKRVRSWLIGCGLGCLGVVVLGIAGCTSFAIWLRQPGELLEPEQLFGARTTGYAEWTLQLDDPGTAEFVDSMFSAVRRQREDLEMLPGPLRWLLMRSQQRDERKMRELFPMVLAWTVHPQPGGGPDLHLGTLSIEKLGNRMVFADWMLGWVFRWSPESTVDSYRGEKIYGPEGQDQVVLFLRGADVFVTSNVQTARQALDMLAGEGRGAPGGTTDTRELQRLFDELPTDRSLRGVVGNANGELSRLWELLLPEVPAPAREEIRAATLTGSFENASDFAGTLSLRGASPGWASENADQLAEALRDAWSAPGVEVEAEVQGDWLRLRFRLPDLPDRVRRTIRIG